MPTASPSVGVCVTNYNYAHYLPDALASIRVGTGVVPSVVVVDDASDDGAVLAPICATAGADLIRLPTNRGLGIARNTGVAYLHTDAWLPLDADDRLYPDALSVLLERLQGKDAPDFVYGDYEEHDVIVPSRGYARDLLLQDNTIGYCALWRTASFWRIGGYSRAAVAEDWEIWRRACAAGLRGAYVAAPIFHHRIHAESKWSRDMRQHDRAWLLRMLERTSPL